MERKITFSSMDHSDPLETHAHQKLDKIETLLGDRGEQTPFFSELRLTANKKHAHHHVELHVRTPRFALDAHDEGPDMYVALDNTVDKMVKLLKKEKSKLKDKEKKTENDKGIFASEDDKYTLS